jgi:hypothetical protein
VRRCGQVKLFGRVGREQRAAFGAERACAPRQCRWNVAIDAKGGLSLIICIDHGPFDRLRRLQFCLASR